eukprot:GFYU01002470.1.p1 GENE.GFYU01002470.1~~GFYU01002470.1.p1  ORF type:complete len:192 (-),score=14.15 GFYU01002470.1:400-975(-)
MVEFLQMQTDELRAIFYLPVISTVAWVATFYFLLGNQRSVKYKLISEYRTKGKTFDRYNNQDGRMTAADRAVGNYLEQTPAFLITMWMHAILVSPDLSGKLGLCWVACRALYPYLLGSSLQNNNPKVVYFATVPCYCIIHYMASSTLVLTCPDTVGVIPGGVWSVMVAFWAVFLGTAKVTPSTVLPQGKHE